MPCMCFLLVLFLLTDLYYCLKGANRAAEEAERDRRDREDRLRHGRNPGARGIPAASGRPRGTQDGAPPTPLTPTSHTGQYTPPCPSSFGLYNSCGVTQLLKKRSVIKNAPRLCYKNNIVKKVILIGQERIGAQTDFIKSSLLLKQVIKKLNQANVYSRKGENKEKNQVRSIKFKHFEYTRDVIHTPSHKILFTGYLQGLQKSKVLNPII